MDNRQISTWVGEVGEAALTLPNEPPKPPLPPFRAPPRRRPDTGRPSERYGHLGIWILCLGPSAKELTGDRFNTVVLDREGKVVRRLVEVPRQFVVEGAAKDDPNVLVDVDPSGQAKEIISNDFATLCGDRQQYLSLLGQWCHRHGRREYAL